VSTKCAACVATARTLSIERPNDLAKFARATILSYVALPRTRCCSVRLSPGLAGGTGGGSPRGGSSRSSVEGAQVDEAVGVLLPAHKEASDQIPPRVRHSAVDPLLKFPPSARPPLPPRGRRAVG